MRFMKLGMLAAISVLASGNAVYAGDTQQNWNGFYVGGNFGAGLSPNESNQGSSPALQPQFPSRPVSQPGYSNRLVSPHGGFQAGYNWQIPKSPFVLGIEGDQSR